MKITALSVVSDPDPWPNGDRLLAFFSVEFGGFRLHDCLLIRTKRGFLLAQGPRGDAKKGECRAIQIVDAGIRKAMGEAAYNAFVALGNVETAAA